MLENKIKQIGLFKTAKALNITPQRLHNWIRRKSYPVNFIRPLAKVLNMSVEDLLKEVEKDKR